MSNLIFDEKAFKEGIFIALKEKITQAINYQELHRLIDCVIDERGDEIRGLVRESLDGIFADDDCKNEIKDAFKHKVARALAAKMEGAVEKSVNSYRNDPVLNARMITALENIVSENQ